MHSLPVARALLSVTDKSGLVGFARFLHENGVELVSTGGTHRLLSEEGLAVTPVSKVTGFPEILGGRVKTLHPHIHAGILADKDDADHRETLESFGLRAFDLICVNLYDFAQAAAQGLDLKEAVEQIDIGGPCMLRAAAKNFHSVCVVPDPGDYGRVMDELAHGDFVLGLELRRELAVKAFAATSRYDRLIYEYLQSREA